MPEINGVSLPFIPAGGADELRRGAKPPVELKQNQTSFKDVFEQEVGKLKFSAHAQNRINSRDMALSQDDMQKLEAAVDKAGAKGSQESLVLLRDMAFIVSVPNKTVITAVQSDKIQGNVFTNIDSAIVA